MKLKALVTGLLISLLAPAVAVANEPGVVRVPVLSATLSTSTVEVGDAFRITGKIKPAKAGVVVQRLRLLDGKWVPVKNGIAKTTKTGNWSMKVVAPSKPTKLKYKIVTPKTKTSAPIWRTVNVVRPLPPTVTINSLADSIPANSFTSFAGTYKNFGKPISIEVQVKQAGEWVPAAAKTTVGASAWVSRIRLPEVAGTYEYRAVASTEDGVGNSVISLEVTPISANEIDRFGAGSPSRILGMDVARYQRLDSTGRDFPIDYELAFARGMRFVIAKASDDLDYADSVARVLAPIDRRDAQAAGLYTGLYHFMGMTDAQGNRAIILDAREEAILAVSRLVEMGGYNALDLPYTLDVEYSSANNSGIADGATDAQIKLWVETFLKEMEARTGRWPMVYGSPSALRKLGEANSFWEKVPFWIARYPSADDHQVALDALNSGRTVDEPTLIRTPWYRNGATAWTFWQYSSSGPAKYYGVRNGQTRLDMNVFNGTTADFMKLVQGNWTPLPGDYQATNSEIDLQILQTSALPNATSTIRVKAIRVENGADVVSGNLVVRQNGRAITGASVIPDGVGEWIVNLPPQFQGFQWIDLDIQFTDSFGYYAAKNTVTTLTVLAE